MNCNNGTEESEPRELGGEDDEFGESPRHGSPTFARAKEGRGRTVSVG